MMNRANGGKRVMEEKNISDQVILRVLNMPDEEFAALSVGKLARLFEMDRYKLSRQFKRQTEITLEEFLYKEKMTRAALLLVAYRDITVKDVSKKVGFCSPDYFIRKFRQFYGVVPGKYREFKTKRKQNSHHIDHDNPNPLPGQVLAVNDVRKGNSCETCYFRLFSLNFDDLK